MNWTDSVGSLRSYCSHRKSQFTSLRWTKLRFITEEHTGVLSEPELYAHVSVTCWGIIHPPRIPDWEEARFTQTEWEIWREREKQNSTFLEWCKQDTDVFLFSLKLVLMCVIHAVMMSLVSILIPFYEKDLHDQYELLQMMSCLFFCFFFKSYKLADSLKLDNST